MLVELIRRARVVTWVLIVLLVGGATVPVALHAGIDDDPYCDPPLVSADARQAFTTPRPVPQAQHCEVCHWLRSIRSFDAAQAPASVTLRPELDPPVAALPVPPSQTAPSLVARAPPA